MLLINQKLSYSTDRLKRVRGYSKFCDVTEVTENQLDLDDAVMVGDFIAGKVICDKQSTLCVVKILSLKNKGSGKYHTAISSNEFMNSQVTGRLMPAKVEGIHLKFLYPTLCMKLCGKAKIAQPSTLMIQ